MRLAAICVLAVCAAGLACIPLAINGQLSFRSLFYEQFARFEGPAIALVAAFAIAALVSNPGGPADPWEPRVSERQARLVTWMAIAFASIVIIAGFHVAFDGYFLADDEYSAWFQTLIYAGGQARAVVPPEWCRWIDAMTPTSVAVVPPCTWKLSFLPLHSLFRSLFVALKVDFLAGPVTVALTIGLVAATARRLWPDRPRRTLVAVVVLATSVQMLFMSMTMYSMPTHLLVSACWLWLFVIGTPWAIVLLPMVGFVAFGVHSPIPHGLWVIPFILRFLWQRRWGAFLYVSAGYALAAAFWTKQLGIGGRGAEGLPIASISATVGAVRSPFSVPQVIDQLTTVMHFVLIGTWNSPLVFLCLFVVALSWRRLDSMSHDLIASLMLIIIARGFEPTPQGEGWGYRYIYDALSNIALLTACGLDIIAQAIGTRRAMKLAIASFATSVLIQIPMRTMNVRSVVVPYARTYRWMASRPDSVVVFDANDVMWGRQMLRNDPYLHARPVLMEIHALPKGGLAELQARFPGAVKRVTHDEILQFGAPAAPVRFGGLIIQR